MEKQLTARRLDSDTYKAQITQLTGLVSSLQQQVNAITQGIGIPISTGVPGIDLVGSNLTFSLISLFKNTVTFVTKVILSGLTASLPLKLNASNEITSAAISLTTEISGILARVNGGLGNNAVTAYAGTFSGTISGTANLVTGAVTGTCVGTTSTNV